MVFCLTWLTQESDPNQPSSTKRTAILQDCIHQHTSLATGQCKMQTVDCKLQTESKTQAGCKMQNKDCRRFLTFVLLLLQIGEIAGWYQSHTSLPNRSELHIRQKSQWTSEQLKSAYLDLQYFHRRSSKFPAEHLSLLLEWFTPYFIAIILPVQYFGSAAFI